MHFPLHNSTVFFLCIFSLHISTAYSHCGNMHAQGTATRNSCGENATATVWQRCGFAWGRGRAHPSTHTVSLDSCLCHSRVACCWSSPKHTHGVVGQPFACVAACGCVLFESASFAARTCSRPSTIQTRTTCGRGGTTFHAPTSVLVTNMRL